MPTMTQQATSAGKQINSQNQRTPQKITQLLCSDQNFQLKNIFVTWMSQGFKYMPNLLSKIYLQLQLIINFIEYRFTISQNHPQVGDFLQNIQYKNLTKKTKILYLLLDIILPYVKKRALLYLQSRVEEEKYEKQDEENPQDRTNIKKTVKFFLRKLISLIRFFDKILAIANILNLSIFIYKGKYRNLIQRILKMEMVFVNPQNSRVLNFSLMNRTIIWQVYEMVLKNVLPFLHKFLGQGLKNIFYLHSYMGVSGDQNETNCTVCNEIPTMAVKPTSCKHIYCFYCLKSMGAQKKQCKKCGNVITQWDMLKV